LRSTPGPPGRRDGAARRPPRHPAGGHRRAGRRLGRGAARAGRGVVVAAVGGDRGGRRGVPQRRGDGRGPRGRPGLIAERPRGADQESTETISTTNTRFLPASGSPSTSSVPYPYSAGTLIRTVEPTFCPMTPTLNPGTTPSVGNCAGWPLAPKFC